MSISQESPCLLRLVTFSTVSCGDQSMQRGGEGLGRICSVKSVSGFRIMVAVGKSENFIPKWSALSTVRNRLLILGKYLFQASELDRWKDAKIWRALFKN